MNKSRWNPTSNFETKSTNIGEHPLSIPYAPIIIIIFFFHFTFTKKKKKNIGPIVDRHDA